MGIVENIILAQEILYTMKGKKGKGALLGIKINMNKTYDKIESRIIVQIMLRLVFSNQFCDLHRQCLLIKT